MNNTDTIGNKKAVSGLGLSSGGLDSILAGVVLRDQGITVEWISFETPFFSADKAISAADALGVPITVRDITAEYLPMLKNPPCGYGQHMNPCMDCHALMARLAGDIMREKGFDFIFSGEVAGQRPMSQTKPSLRYVEKRSGMDGYLLRPLSAKCLPETIPEQQGLVDRDRLLDISGRSRKRQIALAESYGITDYPSPAGGCLLTEETFSKRLKDLFNHQDEYSPNDLNLLRYGRHFRLSPTTKLIVGRTQQDNQDILAHQDVAGATVLKVDGIPGPIALLIGETAEGPLMLGAGICAGYSKAPAEEPVKVLATTGKKTQRLAMMAIPPKKVQHLMI
ncbi:MAG: tRNA 4-thiouridine(8) synthase ThiI [Thermodesulfobacteriota bacterium]|nr:tRNA 4-thiouridine(8) synthase ThiI [Thermodesulfobacteriota bacterium]